MFHKAINLKFNKGTQLEVSFQDGKIVQYDMSDLFSKYPQLIALTDRELFLSGKLMGFYGIVWNDGLDIETETIYEEGKIINTIPVSANMAVGDALLEARARKNFSQKELSMRSGVDQSDISKIERGLHNPTVNMLKRIADALDTELVIKFKEKA